MITSALVVALFICMVQFFMKLFGGLIGFIFRGMFAVVGVAIVLALIKII